MSFSFKKLNWDTDFFGFNVGQINGPIISEKDLNILGNLLKENKTKLSYFSSQIEIPNNLLKGHNFFLKLVDLKTTFEKKAINHSEVFEEIEPANKNENLLILDSLAIQSGEYSRFKIDKNIDEEKFKELYKLWIQNSIEKKIAKEVLVYKHKNEIIGFITLGEKNKKGDIGIIAVDQNHRGKGIGKKLIFAAEKWFLDHNYSAIQVVTQGNNVAACKLYESCQFEILKKEYFYHIWNN